MNNKKSIQKAKQEIDPDMVAKIDEIISEADRVKGETLVLHESGELETQNVIDKILAEASAIDNPAEKFDLYYKGIEKTLRKHLPKGKENKRARELIREEKCVYLTRGKRKDAKGLRHADSRQTYIDDAKEMYKMILHWAAIGANMADLHNTLQDANVAKGYGKRTIY